MKDLVDIVIVGGGNPDIIKLIRAINRFTQQYRIVGILDKNTDLHGQDIAGCKVLGGDELLLSEFAECAIALNVSQTPQLRSKVAMWLRENLPRASFPNLVHPSVDLEDVTLGVGNVIYEQVSIASHVVLGDFNLIYPCTVIGHEARIGNCNLVAAGTVVSGRTILGNRVLVGNGAVMVPGVKIADDVVVGTGSVVTKPVMQRCTIFGNPAKPLPGTLKQAD